MWIKICGIRDVETSLAVARCGPQAIGLNFYAHSPRSVDPQIAAEIVRQLPAGVEPVGVFVNHPVEQLQDITHRCGLRTVQLHGDEPPEMLAKLAEFKIIRAFRVGSDGLAQMADYLDLCRSLGATPAACLVEARTEGVYGGAGKLAPWDLLARDYRRDEWPPLILAGGLHPANIADAIRTVQPWGVDVAGGVESGPGIKDAALVQEFIANAAGSGQ